MVPTATTSLPNNNPKTLTACIRQKAVIATRYLFVFFPRGLLSSVQHCAEWAAGAEGQEPIRKCLRSLGAVFRLAVRSRRLFARATGGQYEDSFRRDVRAALHALKALAQHPHRDHLAPAQVYTKCSSNHTNSQTQTDSIHV